MDYSMIVSYECICTTILSMLCCSFVLYCFIRFQMLRDDQFIIIANIIIFDFISAAVLFTDSFAYLFLKDSDFELSDIPGLCLTQSFLSSFTVLASSFWTSIMCHNLYHTVRYGRTEYKQTLYHFFGYLVPLFFGLLPFAFNAYGQYNVMPQTNCFFDTDKQQFILYEATLFYFPILILFCYNIVIISIVIYNLKTLYHRESTTEQTNIYGLFVYPTILAVCWIIPSFMDLIPSVKNSPIWPCISFPLVTSLGTFDAYSYCYLSLSQQIKAKGCDICLKNDTLDFEEELCPNM